MQIHKAEMYKDGEEQEEKQGLLIADTWWKSTAVHSDLLRRQTADFITD